MDNAILIGQFAAISPTAGGRGDVVPSPLNADPPGQSRGGLQIGTNGQQGQQGGRGIIAIPGLIRRTASDPAAGPYFRVQSQAGSNRRHKVRRYARVRTTRR
jgi:hypothetical protein